jgi:hypothetical protein
VHVDHVVERRRPRWLLPNLAGQHLPRYELLVMTQQVLQEVELAGCELDGPVSSRHPSADQIHLEVDRLQSQHLIRPTATQQGTDAGEQLREREGFHEVVVRTAVEPEHPVLDRVPGRQDEHRRTESASPQRRQDIDTVATGKHQVEHDEIECLGVDTKGIRLLDGDETTRVNLEGRLPRLMRDAGFVDVSETHRGMTLFGTLALYRGTRPPGA